MQNYFITTDSGCDLLYDFVKSIDVIPLKMKYIIDSKEYTDSMTQSQYDKFFNDMKDGAVPTTVQINPLEFVEFFTPLAEENKPIVHICMSSGISGTYQNALSAKEMLLEKFPNLKLYIVDTLMTSTGNGSLCILASKLRSEGKSAAECAEILEDKKLSVHACFTTDDITYLHRGGRVSKIGYVVSKALKIYPVMRVNNNGELRVFAKARGQKATWDTILKYIEDNVVSPEEQTIYISDAANDDGAKKLGALIQSRFHFKDVFYSRIGTIIGTHTGPNLLTIFFMGVDRQPD